MGFASQTYFEEKSKVQKLVLQTIKEVCDAKITKEDVARDGCNIPNWSMSLVDLAYGYARFGEAENLSKLQNEGCQKILKATFTHPLMIAGENRHCSRIAKELAPNVFAKVGADGIYGACFPKLKLGLAIKIDDGSTAASELALNQVIAKLGLFKGKKNLKKEWLKPKVYNLQKQKTGYWNVSF